MSDIKYYLNKENAKTLVDGVKRNFAPISHTHTKNDIKDLAFDSSLSSESTNAVQNKVVTSALNSKVPTSRTINGKALTSNISLSASDVKADPSGSANSALASAKTYTDSAVAAVKNDLLNGAGTAYDTLKELGDLIDDNADAIDALESVAAGKADKTHSHAISDVSGLQSALDGKATLSHGAHVSYSTANPVMDGSASVGTASTVARSDHKHPTDTSRASQTSLDTHTGNTTSHITSSERTNWNAAKTHADTAHAPSNAEKNQNAFSYVKVGDTSVAADSATDTLTLVAGTNVTITPDATNDKITISAKDTTYSLSSFGITATASELNKLDGVTATATEINYIDGVTSNVQTQLDSKVPSSRTVNGKALSSNISLSYSDVGAAASSHTHNYLPLSGGNLTGNLGIGNKYELSPAYNFANGCLIDIGAAKSSTMVAIHITGNSYNSSTSPIDSLFQFYDYGDGTIMNYSGVNLGLSLGAMTVYRHNNRLYAHIKQTADYQTLSFTLLTNKSGLTPSISNTSAHTSGYTDKITITPKNVSMDGHTHSYAGSSSAGGAANSAIKATQDASGNTITSTYATKTELDTAKSTLQTSINGKANSSHTHAIANITNLQTSLDSKSNTSHTHNYAGSSSAGGSATSADKVNKALTVQLNSGTIEGTNKFTFDGSATKSVNITPSAIGASASGHTHDDKYYTETEIDTKLSGKANSSHGNHVPTTQTVSNKVFLRNDNTWATVTPANIGAAASSHNHTLANITDLTASAKELNYMDGVTSNVQTQLDGKAASSHNHAASNITSGILSSDRLPTVPITKGGTGATTAAGALTNLGITATAAELNYVDGVTSNIQTQLNGKSGTSHTHSYLPLAGGTISGQLDADKVFRNGNTFYNVLEFASTATVDEIVIKTRIPFQSGNSMPLVHLKGYAYGESATIEMTVAFYIYNDKFTNMGVVSSCPWKPSVYLSSYTENNTKYIAISFSGSIYYPRFVVDYTDIWAGSGNRDYSSGWTSANRASGGTTSVIPATDKVDVPYKPIANNISGNASTATNVAWCGVTSKPSYYDAKAIKGVTRSGTTFTYTCMDGTTGTFTQQDNNTTYGAVTTSTNGLMIASDKVKLDGMVLATVSEVESYLGI